MHLRFALLGTLFLIACPRAALACDPLPGWQPPTPKAAFAKASVVVHARVESVQGQDPWSAKLSVLKSLKGSLITSTVRTGSHSLCGIGKFEVGKELVSWLEFGSGAVALRYEPRR